MIYRDLGQQVLAEHDVVLKAGEIAEFDTRLPHWFGSTGDAPLRSSHRARWWEP